MPIVYERLLALDIPEVERRLRPKRTRCSTRSGVGLGQDPIDEQELAFVYEKNLKALPTFAVVLGYAGRTGCAGSRDRRDWVKLVQGEQSLELHRPLAPSGTVVGSTASSK